MKVGSLFSGVGGFDLGLERSGMDVVWQVEFDKQARSVLRRHWPDVDLHKDVCDVGKAKTLDEWAVRSQAGTDLAPGDLICGGFPCQDVSVAGKRAGLAGERSGLWWEFHRIIGELAPAWVLIENVPGLLSSNGGEDMATVLRGLEELGYGWSYRILDSQYFGVAQRRRRVFIVGRAGGFCPPEILLEPEGVFGDSAPSRTAGEEVAGTIAAGAHPSGFNGQDAERGNVVTHSLTSEGFDASEDGTGRGTPLVAQTITAEMYRSGGAVAGNNNQGVRNVYLDQPQSLAVRGRDGVPQAELGTDGQANALLTPNGGRAGVGAGAVLAAVPRRLTPTECERLQGFPDGWTEGLADGPRYRMMGNAITVNVAEWIGHRIMAAIK